MKEIRLNRLSALPPLSIDSQARGTYVLVIGESASRDHMHVYGYDRQTTPWMDKMAGCKGTTIFSYPYANYCQTILSLTYALSEKNQYNHIPLEEAYSIIDLAKAAGYDTYWISNQAGFSASDTPITIISSTAAHHTWINGRGASPSDSTYLDGKLITELPDNVDRPSFIVIHLMGSHSRYADRYPKSYSLFSGRGKFVDGYDNSVRYVDSVLQGIFEKVHNYSNFQGFLYLPDHGEDPESGNAHSPDKFTFQMVRIPFLVYLSPKAIVNRPEIQKELQKHKDLPWTNDLAYNLLISLLGIQNAPYEERQWFYNLFWGAKVTVQMRVLSAPTFFSIKK
ncbi:phosphoethanolamine transferase [Acidaminococcus intestini]|nr:phosphoethanolamine transferase [Acidaminococcus intestini]